MQLFITKVTAVPPSGEYVDEYKPSEGATDDPAVMRLYHQNQNRRLVR